MQWFGTRTVGATVSEQSVTYNGITVVGTAHWQRSWCLWANRSMGTHGRRGKTWRSTIGGANADLSRSQREFGAICTSSGPTGNVFRAWSGRHPCAPGVGPGLWRSDADRRARNQ